MIIPIIIYLGLLTFCNIVIIIIEGEDYGDY